MNKKKPHTEEELKDFFSNENLNDKYFQKFLSFYKLCFNELYQEYKDWEDNEFEEEDSIQVMALTVALERIKKMSKEIEKGHGEKWAEIISFSSEEGEPLISHTYMELMKIDAQLAKNEIQILAKSFLEDEYFEKHYLFLFEVVADIKGRIETAKEYSKIYKEQIKDGKSDVFSHEYADLMSENEESDIYCIAYALGYEHNYLINNNKEHSQKFAYDFADYVDKNYWTISDYNHENDLEFVWTKGCLNAWNYSKGNNIKPIQFINNYVDLFVNLYYSNKGKKENSNINFDDLVLNKTLALFTK